MKTTFNTKIQRNVLRLVTSQKPEFIYGYKSYKTEGIEVHLQYHSDQVRVVYCRYNSDGYRSGGTSIPLGSTDCKSTFHKELYQFAKILFRRDKKAGVVSENYKFN
jgi:hypothetical protein